MFTHTTPITK
ncbi:unnamed protein product [Acanthoscelides obtectus]|uniref:Uncharacterized protein n=1 Tax=Acanthoscelides obtectus TaxID=200917 RepID=A0A9P0P7J6_ACAOB|nr:unnamed protein product [Acanthoscelides obtectus]CAK1671990.1 hypothetical protein AOBTE_LOCUS28595 [Acanthoscelides obtectus]